MIRFLFWNVCGVASVRERSQGKGKGDLSGKVRPLHREDHRFTELRRVIGILVRQHEAAVVILAESPFVGNPMLNGFIEAPTSLQANQRTGTRLEIYHRDTVQFTGHEVVDRAVLHRMTAVASGRSILLVSTHLYSALNLTEKKRERKVKQLASDIRDEEVRLGHKQTILVGDLNYDPHDLPVIDPEGLNAVASKVVARRGECREGRLSYPYFYNPMWAHLSDLSGELPGTYFLSGGGLDNRVWYLPDQILLRPALLDCWSDTNLHVLSGAGKITLLDKQGHPNQKKFSDHLPIVFALDL